MPLALAGAVAVAVSVMRVVDEVTLLAIAAIGAAPNRLAVWRQRPHQPHKPHQPHQPHQATSHTSRTSDSSSSSSTNPPARRLHVDRDGGSHRPRDGRGGGGNSHDSGRRASCALAAVSRVREGGLAAVRKRLRAAGVSSGGSRRAAWLADARATARCDRRGPDHARARLHHRHVRRLSTRRMAGRPRGDRGHLRAGVRLPWRRVGRSFQRCAGRA